MSETTRRRRLRRQSRGRAASGGPADATFDVLSHPIALGTLCALAGAGLMIAPWLRQPEHLSATWWVDAFRDPELMQVIMALLCVALILSAGLAYRAATGHREELGPDDLADISLRPHTQEAMPPHGSRLLWGALVSMVVGLALGVGSWATLLRDVAPTEGAFPLNQAVESINASVRGKPLKVMLPRRVTVTALQAPQDRKNPWTVSVSFTKPKQEEIAEQQLVLGESVEVVDRRFTFVGVRGDFTRPRAIVSGTGENTITATGQKGGTIKVSLNGPTYTIKEMVPNHLNMMGPAIQLEDAAGGKFWLYQRQPAKGQAFGHGLKLERLESAPAAVFSVSPILPFWPLLAGGLFFTFGLGGLFMIPDVRRRRRGRDRGLFSINDAGALAEQYAPYQAPEAPVVQEEPIEVVSAEEEE